MPQFYCPDCQCTVTTESAASLPGCVLVSGDGDSMGTDPGAGGTSQDPDVNGAGDGSGITSGNSTFGIAPFGLGLESFFKSLCKILPDGLCDLVKKIIVILLIVLLIIVAMKVYKTFKK
jgi:hypothetical protein